MESARLEIHQINVGQGDSILIVNRDLDKVKEAIQKGSGTLPTEPIDYVPYAVKQGISLAGTVKAALLVDGGDDEYGGDVVNYLITYGVLKEGVGWTQHLKVLVSHYHDDHMAGLRSLFKKRVDPKNPGDKVNFVDRFWPGEIYLSAPGNEKSKPQSQRYVKFLEDVKEATAKSTASTLYILKPGGLNDKNETTVIELGEGIDSIPIKAYVLASGQAVYDYKNKRITRIKSVGTTVDQNDRSIVLVLEYGSFRLFLGGDIAGNGGPKGGNHGSNAMDTSTKKYFSKHADVESILGPALEQFFPETPTSGWKKGEHKYPNAGYCTVMKANHHGSSSSVDVHFLATLQPCILLISSGVKARFHSHPTQQVINRASIGQNKKWEVRPIGATTSALEVNNTIKYIFITEVGDKVKNNKFQVDLRDSKILGDIVVRPIDENVVDVQNANKKGMSRLVMQVYGSGEQTGALDAGTTLCPTLKRDDKSIYPIGPFYVTDDRF